MHHPRVSARLIAGTRRTDHHRRGVGRRRGAGRRESRGRKTSTIRPRKV